MALRNDLALISEWIATGSHVLDLGCGDGTLLAYLHDMRQVTGYGLEIDDNNIELCIKAGIDFMDNSFDYVMMTQAIQTIRRPDKLLMEMLRLGREGIVTFPNFGHWQARFSLFFSGIMPISRALPNQWYNTENIHLCTLRDFEKLCELLDIQILQRTVVDTKHRTSTAMQLIPNLFGEIALYRFRRKPTKIYLNK
jgi:methionine biosynthesis protein MetW